MRRLLVLLLVFQCFGAAAERFVPLGTRDGLGNRRVYRVCQDGEGYLWFFLTGGIDRYDGFEFRHYPFSERDGLDRNLPSEGKLKTGPDGRVHCLLTQGRVFVYDRNVDRFVQEYELPGDARLFSGAFTESGRWLGTSEGLLFDGNDGSSARFFEGLSVRDFCSLEDGTIFAATETGLFREVGGEPRKLLDGEFTTLLPLGNGRVLAGSFSQGLFLVSPSSERILPVAGIPHVPVRSMVRDGGKVYVGLDGEGVFVYDPEADRLEGHFVTSDDEEGLCANSVSDLCVDARGNLWVTTTSNGVCVLDRNPWNVKWVRHRTGDPSSLLSNHVSAVLEDRSGRVWYGTDRGLCRYDPSDASWRVFRRSDAENVLALSETSDGSIWAGEYGFPVFQVSPSGAMTVLPDLPGHVFALTAAGESVWTGGLAPVALYDRTGSLTISAETVEVWDFVLDGSGLWAASTRGLVRIDPVTGAESQPVEGPFREPLWCVTVDGAGRVWAGTQNGILGYEPSSGSWHSIPLGGQVCSIVADRDGVLWAATDDRLFRVDPVRHVAAVMNGILGIDRGTFNHTASARLSDGTVAFGTGDGVLLFNPEPAGGEVPAAVVPVLTDFRLLSGNDAAREKILKGKAVGTLDRVVLPSDERSFEIAFSALGFDARSRIRFEYALEDHDPNYRSSLSAATVTYPSVPAGRYVFRVRCVDSVMDSVLGTRELEVIVRRPPLLSTVAQILYVLLLSGGVLLFIRIRRREAARRATRERLDTFIHFAHELKTPVSLIKAPLSDLQRDEALPEGDRQSVSTAMRNADRLMAMINSLLDLREDAPEAGRLYLEPTDLREFLEDGVEPFQPAARQKGIALSCTVDEGLGPVPVDREKMDRIVQNLVSNAVKYTEKGSVEVTAAPAGRMWRLEVRDTGIGVPAEARSRIFNGGVRAANARDVDETGYGIGLMITRQLVLQLGGSISLKSEEGSGSAFTLLFPTEYRASRDVILAPEPAVPAEEDSPAEAGPKRILVVEDDPEMLGYLKGTLSGEFETLTASDGETAFRLAEESQPDLVLSDVVMPGMNGYDLCRRLKSTLATSHIPVILLTAMDDREHIILGLESGSDDYVVKPFDPQVLTARISNLLHERERLRELILRAGREEKRREYTNQLDREFMEKVLAVMDKSCADPLFQVDDLCREVAMSRTAFYNKLKAVTGKSPNDFIRIFRLERAAELLTAEGLNVTEVADRVGFSDPKYFSSCFRRHFGVSPSKY